MAATNAAPSISGASVNRPHLLLPLHQMVPVFQQGLAGLTSPDWVVLDANHVRLRAERSVRGDGRVYTIRITATDEGGGIATQDVTVSAPRRAFGWFD